MQWTGLNDLREMYLKFFESKGHLRLASYPLVPEGDKSLLLINSGMAPMKKWFLGQETPPRQRVTTCQKCIRTPDIESVGITDRHGTYFEMLGNFSFQDYFKHEAINWAWEFFTSKEWLDIPAEKLHITVYLEDDEAYNIWTKEIGVEESRMVRLGKEDNFWEHGSGPCGPCSEIHFDRGEKYGCNKPGCKPGCDCDRYIEVWNLVFTEFNSDGNGNYEKLENPNIDTGMGLERLACVMQDANNLFETDTVGKILKHAENISGKKYGDNKHHDVSIRVITDHIRSTTFMVSDGILPSNEGRGYVLRRLLRRAARHGRLLGINRPFLAEICDTVIEQNKTAYPELEANKGYIKKTIAAEEERFGRTIDAGLNRLNEMLKKVVEDGTGKAKKVLSGEDAFRLNDTFGFPLDLTKEIAAELGVDVDIDAFETELEKQRRKAREDRASQDIDGWETDLFAQADAAPTIFTGYNLLNESSKVISLSDGNELIDAISTDDGEKRNVLVILDKTPFYAESGGQVADTGIISNNNCNLRVMSVKKTSKGFFVHNCTLMSGVIKTGDNINAQVDEARRKAIMRNHTSAHLLQSALREVLGEHVHQAGSYVDDERMRFDFTHFSAMTNEEIRRVEDLVNNKIFDAIDVCAKEMPLEDAKQIGAMALFGEKYDDVVRVVEVEGFSREFCGGTHVSNTSHLGCFKILAEASVGAGVRRIEGTTGYGVLRILDEHERLIRNVSGLLKVGHTKDLANRVSLFVNELKKLEQENNKLKNAVASDMANNLFNNAKNINGIDIFTAQLENVEGNELRQMCDKIRESKPASVGILFATGTKKSTLAVCCGKDAVAKGLSSNEIIKKISSIAGGKGGGKADFAMAGISDLTKIKDALNASYDIIKEML